MSALKSPLLIALALTGVAVLAAGLFILHRPRSARIPFTIWRALSSQAHGGRYAAIDGVRIYYETFGSGAPVLVLHGGGGSLENMAYQIRALAPTHWVIAPDSRAQGRSTDSDTPLSYALMAEDMLKLLDELHVVRTDIVGWSDGGIIALHLAIKHPERVGRIVVIGANYDAAGLIVPTVAGGPIAPAPRWYRRIAPDPSYWPVLFRKLVALWATEPHYTLAELASIRAPTLIIAGEFDIARREHTDQMARAIPHSEECIIPGGTHGLIWEEPDIVNARMLEFLARSRSDPESGPNRHGDGRTLPGVG